MDSLDYPNGIKINWGNYPYYGDQKKQRAIMRSYEMLGSPLILKHDRQTRKIEW